MKPVPHGEPYARKLHVRFDAGAGVPDNKGRPALLYTLIGPVSDFGGRREMSEVNYRRNGQKYSSSGHCWGLSPKVGKVKVEDPNTPKPKSSRERRALKKGK